MAEERQRLNKEDIARQEEQELDKIRSQIPDLKIAHTLSDQNPLKKFLYSLENQTKPGLVYRAFCLFCLVTIWVIQGAAFYYKNPSTLIMLPLTAGTTSLLFYFFQKNIGKAVSTFDCQYNFSIFPNSLNKIFYFLFGVFFLTIILYANDFYFGEVITDAKTAAPFHGYVFFLIFIFTILLSCNDFYCLYERKKIGNFLNKENLIARLTPLFVLLFSPFLNWYFLRKSIFMENSYFWDYFLFVCYSLGAFFISYIAVTLLAFFYYLGIRHCATFLNDLLRRR